MHIKRFNEFVTELRDDPAVTNLVPALEVFRRFQGVWYRDDGLEVSDDKLTKALAFTLDLAIPWRRRNDTSAFFPVPSLEAVVLGAFNNKPTKHTRAKVYDQLRSSFRRCSDAYHARHDGLTGLLNKPAFDTVLHDKLHQFQTGVADSIDDETNNTMDFNSLVLLTLDIDFFKRVNDSYGHAYGDIVLKAFAIRLERACLQMNEFDRYKAENYCARPSGEEFSVLLVGQVGPDAEMDAADFIREKIVSEPLPSEAELTIMADDQRLRGVELPPITERCITPSVGLSSRHSGIPIDSVEAVAERLKVEADLALYRAKALGRNRCIRFPDIVKRHGQVLQHHTDVNVVAIDLGQQVGVSLGQEFLVFHPDFTGAKPFVLRDGRGERRLVH